MGDVVLTTHLVRNIRKKFPDARIDFLVSKDYTEILKYNRHLDNVVAYHKSWTNNEIREAKKSIIENNGGRYDFIADLQNNTRTDIFLNGLGHYISPVRKLRLHKLSQVYFKMSLEHDFTIPDIYLETVKDLDVKDDGLGLEFWLERDKESDYLIKRDGRFSLTKIGIAPGAHFFTKRWLKNHFVELINMINYEGKYEITLLGGIGDNEVCNYIENQSRSTVNNLAGKLSITGSAEEIEKQDILITNDTGLMHIAAAMNVPVLAIFGSSVRQFGFTPFRIPFVIAENNVKCRPCSHIGRNSCPKKHFNCMTEILPSEVYQLFIKFCMDLRLDLNKT